MLPPEFHDSVTPANRSINASGYTFPDFGSANGMVNSSTQNNDALQSAAQFAHQQSPFGGSVTMFCPSTHNIGASNSAVQPVAHQHSHFGRTSQPMTTSFSFGESPSASGFGASNPSYGCLVNPIAPTSRAPAFGSNTANPSPFGASTSAYHFGASNPTFSSAANPIAPTWSAPAFGSTTTNTIPFGASTSANYCLGAPNSTFGSVVNHVARTYRPSAFGSTTAHPISSVAPTSSAHVFGSTPANPAPFGGSIFSATIANSIPFGSSTSWSTTTSPSAFGGSGQSFYYNQQFGSRLRPYTQTLDSDSQKLISISAMDIYNNRSHEELRLEDYMQRIKVSSLFSPAPVAANSSNHVGQDQSNPQQSATLLPGQYSQSNSFNGTSSSIPVTGTNSFVNYNTQPQPSAFHNFPVAIVTFIPPEVAPYIASYVPLLGTQTSATTTPFGHPTTNVTSPSSNLFGGSPAMTGSVGAPSTTSVGLNVPIKTPSTAPTASIPCNFGGYVRCSSSGGQSTVSASASSPIMGTSASQSMFHFPAPSPLFGTQEAFKNTASSTPFGKMQTIEFGTSIPKGLEIIYEKLGFNPWSLEKGTANQPDSEVGSVLPCVDADKDEDIIALAEFAVEQHNTSHKDDLTFVKVVVACLEAVGGGRYHIVLETLIPWKRFYAVVLRKGTQRSNQVTVLEKWVSS